MEFESVGIETHGYDSEVVMGKITIAENFIGLGY